MTGFGLLTFQAAASGWLPLLLVALVAAVVAFVVGRTRASRTRTERAADARRAAPIVPEPATSPAPPPTPEPAQASSPPARGATPTPILVPPPTPAVTVADVAAAHWQQRLDALATGAAPDPDAPSAEADRLGLRSRVPRAELADAEPTVYWGVRNTSQVFIRLGVGEQNEGSDHTTGGRRLECTVVRAALPSFRLRGEGGRIRADGGQVPPAAQAVLDALAHAPDVWERLLVTAGPDGIVAVRPQLGAGSHDWVHDLWLLERLAAAADGDPLPAARVGPAWRVPYGMGRR